MIYLFTGTDEMGVRTKALAWVAASRAKAPDAVYVRLDGAGITLEALREAISSQGLFFSKTLLALDDPFSRAESAEAVTELLSELASTPNIVAIIAPKPTAKELKLLTEHAHKTFTVTAAPKRARGFNSALVNALGARNQTALWSEIQRAYAEGDPPELVHGLLHWKARDLLQKGGRGWTKDQARLLSVSLISLVADSRGKGLPLDAALERFALTLT